MASETGTIERQLRLIRILASRRQGVTVAELTEEFGASHKTIRRDLERLQTVGFPLTSRLESHGRARWTLDSESITGTGLSHDEAFALSFAIGSLAPWAGTVIGDAAQSALKKLQSGLGERSLAYCIRLGRAMAVCQLRSVDYSDKCDLLEQILFAIEDCKNVFISYQSRRSTEPVTYPISPYAMRQYHGAIYIIGHSEQHDEIRIFKLDRISDAEVSEIRFTVPKEFDAEQYLQSGLGIYASGEPQQVQLRFAPEAAQFLSESKWHTSQKLEPQADGSVLASYNVSINPELIGWILSIGPDVKVMKPRALQKAVYEKAKAIAAHYHQSTPTV